MFSHQKRIKILHNLFICLLLIVMLGCGSVSPIHNIRPPDSTDINWKTGNLTFLTFNIRAGGGIKNRKESPHHVKTTKENLLKITEAIKSVDPDIIGLQEVRGFNQAKFIAEKLNLNFVYRTHGQGPSSSRWGLALLSKFPISNAQTTSLSQGSYRKILICSIPVGEKIVSVINVHISLSHLGFDDTTYEAQFRAIGRTLKSIESPIVLMGDFNQAYHSSHLSKIREKLIDTCDASETDNSKKACRTGTFGGFFIPDGIFVNGRQIDYIFVDSKYFNVIENGLTPEEYFFVSDHRAFWSKIRIID